MSVYKSTELGPIPLSFTGRHLMQNLREAMTDAIARAEKGNWRGYDDWKPLSIARGKLAQHMSKLEAKAAFSDDNGYNIPRQRLAPGTFGFLHETTVPAQKRWSDDFGRSFLEEQSAPATRSPVEAFSTDELIKELEKRLRPLQTWIPSHINCRSSVVPLTDFTAALKDVRKRAKKRKSTRKHK